MPDEAEQREARTPTPRSQGPVTLKIVDQPFVVGLVVDDGTNVVTVTTVPVVVPAESVEAVYKAAADTHILLVEEVNT
jgi:hypothetical protein